MNYILKYKKIIQIKLILIFMLQATGFDLGFLTRPLSAIGRSNKLSRSKITPLAVIKQKEQWQIEP